MDGGCLSILIAGHPKLKYDLQRPILEEIGSRAESLLTPLQIGYHLTLALEEAYKIGTKPVTEEIVKSVIAKDINEV